MVKKGVATSDQVSCWNFLLIKVIRSSRQYHFKGYKISPENRKIKIKTMAKIFINIVFRKKNFELFQIFRELFSSNICFRKSQIRSTEDGLNLLEWFPWVWQSIPVLRKPIKITSTTFAYNVVFTLFFLLVYLPIVDSFSNFLIRTRTHTCTGGRGTYRRPRMNCLMSRHEPGRSGSALLGILAAQEARCENPLRFFKFRDLEKS